MRVKITHIFLNPKPRGERPLAISISQQRSVGVRVEVETLYGGDGGVATVEKPYCLSSVVSRSHCRLLSSSMRTLRRMVQHGREVELTASKRQIRSQSQHRNYAHFAKLSSPAASEPFAIGISSGQRRGYMRVGGKKDNQCPRHESTGIKSAM